MTNSIHKMAGKNSAAGNGTPGRPKSTSKLRPLKVVNATHISSVATPPRSKPMHINNKLNISFVDGYKNNIIEVSNNNNSVAGLRLSPSTTTTTPSYKCGGSSPPNATSSSQRTSPGLIAGYFAGGKWSEPPSPATLPKPPMHWTQLMFVANKCSTFTGGKTQQHADIASQLKVLLNVQA